MLIVALTGGIASGKSIVANVFKELGCYLHSADRVAHQLMEPERPVWKAIVDHFGEDMLNQDKTINRAKLGKIVYTSQKERNFLNQLIHPLVLEEKKDIIQKLREKSHHKIFVSEAALTIEAGFADNFDKIVLVYCQKKIQIKRLVERDHINKKEALVKIDSQLSAEKKKRYADHIINSSGSLQNTIEQSERVYRNLMIDYELMYKSAKYQASKVRQE